jgi:hypothetical protein
MLILAALLMTLISPGPALRPAGAASSPCLVQEGQAIGAVRIGMALGEMLRLMGSPLGQVAGGQRQETVYLFSATVSQVTVLGGLVQRLATRSTSCETRAGVRIGASEAEVRTAYARAVGLVRAQAGALTRLVLPFNGVEFVLSSGRVAMIEVFRAESLPAALAAQPTPTPAAAAPQGVVFRSLTGKMDGTNFVVAGSISNSGTPIALYVEIVLLSADGRRIATTTAPLYPNPVGGGRQGGFEERIPVDDVVARFAVTVRPMNRPLQALAERVEEVKDAAQFAGILDRLLEVTILGATLDRPSGTMASVTNRSTLRVTGLVLSVEMVRTCRTQLASGDFFTFTDRRQGTVQVPVLEPNTRVEVPITLQSQGPCPGFAGTAWSATWRIVSAKLETPEKKS